MVLNSTHRGVSRIFHQGQIPFLGSAEIFSTPLKNVCPRGITHNSGSRITYHNLKDTSFDPMRAFFIRGRNILFRISSGYL